MKAPLVLGSILVACLCVPSFADGGGRDAQRFAPFPSPRNSRTGRIAFTASNVQLVGWKTLADFAGGNTDGNDCWGYTSPSGREYAILGMSHGTGFVEVTDPGDPVIVDFEPHNSSPSLWRCIKTYGTFAYAGSEAGGGIQIFNLTNIDSGIVTASSVSGGSCTTATHTLAVDETSGFLYRAGGGGSCGGFYQGLQIYSLANPAIPTLVGTWNTRYVHEAQVVTWDLAGPYLGKQIAFCFTEDTSGGTNPRLQILDVTNKGAITQISSTAYTSGAFSHQGWITTNKQHLYLNDELDDDTFGGARTRMFDIANLAAPVYLGFFTSGAASIDHNLYVKGNKIYEGNYRSGLRIFDNTVPTAPTQIGFFDTYPEDDAREFNSLWSNYPFFASGTIIGGDIEKGLFVWREGAAKLTFDFPGGLPEFIGPGGGLVEFEVNENTPGDLQAGTVKFHYSTGGAFTAVNATPLGGGVYQAVMPPATCGESLDFYVSGRSTDGVTWTDPPAGPTQVHMATAAYGEIVDLSENFETNTGWLVNQAADLVGFSTATAGTWTRVNPVGTAAQPEDDHSAPGTFCFITGQGLAGGGLGDADVDGGATALRSPVLDASGLSDPYISYWRWYSNNQNGVVDDVMTIDVSNNGGSSWVNVETLGPSGSDSVGGWMQHTFRIADFVAPTNNVRLRVRTSDLGTGSIVEAGLDDLAIVDLICNGIAIDTVAPTSGSFDGGNLVTITGSGFQAGVTTVFFGANQAASVVVQSPTSLLVRVPRGLAGSIGRTRLAALKVDVVVNGSGVATDALQNGYTYMLREAQIGGGF